MGELKSRGYFANIDDELNITIYDDLKDYKGFYYKCSVKSSERYKISRLQEMLGEFVTIEINKEDLSKYEKKIKLIGIESLSTIYSVEKQFFKLYFNE